jgi:hypothetical protein
MGELRPRERKRFKLGHGVRKAEVELGHPS